MKEQWKAVKGYEGFYEVSNTGKVRSIDHYVRSRSCNRLVKGRLIKLQIDKDGYYKACLSKENIRKTVFVHRIVATAFIDNPNKYPCINHIDENKQNNRIDNLEFCTFQYNTAYNNGIYKRASKRKKAINQIKNGIIVYVWDCATSASKATKISRGNIVSCLNGYRKTAGGYSWEYL